MINRQVWLLALVFVATIGLVAVSAHSISIELDTDDNVQSEQTVALTTGPDAPEARANVPAKRGEELEDDDANNSSNETEVAGGSRWSLGGEEVPEPFPWLMAAWIKQNAWGYTGEGRFAGFGIHLGNLAALMHKDTCEVSQTSHQKDRPRRPWGNHESRRLSHYTSQFSFVLPQKIDMATGLEGRRLFDCPDSGYELSDGFRVVRLHLVEPQHSQKTIDDYMKHHFQAPPIQKDVHVRDNCSLYSYSSSDSVLGSEINMDRKFSHFPVEVDSCHGASCLMRIQVGFRRPGIVCNKFADLGAPIVCGKDPKLSYLAKPWVRGGCNGRFEAIRLADFYNDLIGALKDPYYIPMYMANLGYMERPPTK